MLRAVDGMTLPVVFRPFDDARGGTARLDSGRMAFDREEGVRAAWHGTGDTDYALLRVFQGSYIEDGARLVIYPARNAIPDTGEVSGRTLTVRAQFTRRLSGERYVVVMTYER